MLHTAHKLEMEASYDDVVDLISKRLSELQPQEILILGARYHIKDWILEAYSILIAKPYEPLALETAEQIGCKGYFHLSSTKEKLVQLRVEAAIHVPFWSYAVCDSWKSCMENWMNIWHSWLTTLLIHPDEPLSGASALSLIEKLDVVPGVCAECLEATKGYILRTNPWKKEAEIVAQGQADLLLSLGFQDKKSDSDE